MPVRLQCINQIYDSKRIMESFSQAAQDIFTRKVLKNKRNGWFLEIGSNHPIKMNNTYVLERDLNWRGIMVELDNSYLQSYRAERPNSIYAMGDAVTMNYRKILDDNHFPKDLDYLQIDLDVDNKSTLDTLINLDTNVMGTYRFAVVTFEHDIYRGDYFNTRNISRDIFEKRGYIRVFSDVRNDNTPYEDWYVHPSLVDLVYISQIISNDSMEWKEIITKL